MGPAYATPAPTGMGASVSVSGRYCVRFRRIRRGPPAGRRPPPAAGRPARWRGRCAGPGARVIPSGQDAGAAGSRPASRPAGIAGPAAPPARTAVSSAPRITAAEEPQGPRRADWPRRPDRIVVAISAANPHGSPPAANVAATPTTSAGDDAEAGTRPPRRPRSSLCTGPGPGLRPDGGADAARAAMTARRSSGRWPGFWAKAAGPRSLAAWARLPVYVGLLAGRAGTARSSSRPLSLWGCPNAQHGFPELGRAAREVSPTGRTAPCMSEPLSRYTLSPAPHDHQRGHAHRASTARNRGYCPIRQIIAVAITRRAVAHSWTFRRLRAARGN